MANVGLIQHQFNKKKLEVVLLTYDLFGKSSKKPLKLVRRLTRETNKSGSVEEFYGFRMKDMMGHRMRVANVPYGHYVRGDPNEHGTGHDNYKNHWGFEIELLKTAAATLNFTYTIMSHPNNQWGDIGTDGKWFGMRKYTINNTVDFTIGAVAITFVTNKVVDPIVPIDDDYLTFVAPIPEEVEKYLAFVHPMGIKVWIFVFTSLLVGPLLAWILIRVEGHLIVGTDNMVLRSLSDVYWFCFGTLVGENLTTDIRNIKRTNTFR